MKLKIIFRALVLTLSGLMSVAAPAVEVNFTANLIQNPPCDVSGPDGVNQPIRVPFGDVGITKINGVNYRQDFTITLSCGAGLGNTVAVYLEYRGMIAPFDENALQASPLGLGIRLYQDGKVVPPNTGLPVNMSSNDSKDLQFYAVTVKDTSPASTLYEGDFTATASMELNYP
ncbi:TPA: fimbrial protein [Providencia alcalifaciens]|nr:fimbrial protein [Providencia alcalifaciens]